MPNDSVCDAQRSSGFLGFFWSYICRYVRHFSQTNFHYAALEHTHTQLIYSYMRLTRVRWQQERMFAHLGPERWKSERLELKRRGKQGLEVEGCRCRRRRRYDGIGRSTKRRRHTGQAAGAGAMDRTHRRRLRSSEQDVFDEERRRSVLRVRHRKHVRFFVAERTAANRRVPEMDKMW